MRKGSDSRHLAQFVTPAVSMRHAGVIAGLGSAGEGGRLDVGRAGQVALTALDFGHFERAIDDVDWPSRPGRRNDQVRPWRSVTAALTQLDEAAALGASKDVAAEILETPVAAMALALLDGDRKRASALIEQAMTAGQSYGEAAVSMVQPAMYTVGSLWEQNLATVAQEHLATGVARTALTKAFVRAAFGPEIERRVVLACVPGNRHSLGSRIVSDCFEIAGWQVHCLGADVPESTLLTRIRIWQPDLVGLSIAQVAQITTARAIIAKIRSEFGRTGPRILVGGLATNQLADAPAELGADAWRHDALTALETPLG